MAKEPDNLVLPMLREIRETQDQHSVLLKAHSEEFKKIHKQLDSLTKVVTYSLGQTTETQFRQTEQEARLDELFDKVEKLLSDKEPS